MKIKKKNVVKIDDKFKLSLVEQATVKGGGGWHRVEVQDHEGNWYTGFELGGVVWGGYEAGLIA